MSCPHAGVDRLPTGWGIPRYLSSLDLLIKRNHWRHEDSEALANAEALTNPFFDGPMKKAITLFVDTSNHIGYSFEAGQEWIMEHIKYVDYKLDVHRAVSDSNHASWEIKPEDLEMNLRMLDVFCVSVPGYTKKRPFFNRVVDACNNFGQTTPGVVILLLLVLVFVIHLGPYKDTYLVD